MLSAETVAAIAAIAGAAVVAVTSKQRQRMWVVPAAGLELAAR